MLKCKYVTLPEDSHGSDTHTEKLYENCDKQSYNIYNIRVM